MKKVAGLGLAALLTLVGGCGAKKKEPAAPRQAMPKTVIVLPAANYSKDHVMPHLIRHFMEREIRSRGFSLKVKAAALDETLRQMGILQGTQIDGSNVRYIGQSVKAEGALLSSLSESWKEKGIRKRTLLAHFQLVSVLNGQVLWQNSVELESKADDIPVYGMLNLESMSGLPRSVINGKAGDWARDMVRRALKTLVR